MFSKYECVMSSEYDGSFRFLSNTEEVMDKWDGDFTMVTINSNNLPEVSALLDAAGEPVPSMGLYIVTNSSVGIIVVFSYNSEADRDADWQHVEDAAVDAEEGP